MLVMIEIIQIIFAFLTNYKKMVKYLLSYFKYLN